MLPRWPKSSCCHNFFQLVHLDSHLILILEHGAVYLMTGDGIHLFNP